MTTSLKAGFIGGGNMASALIGGIANTLTPGNSIHVIDPKPEALARLSARFGVTGATSPDNRLKDCDVIVLAVKPQQIRQAMSELLPFIHRPLILSVAAGIGTADLARWMNGYASIVRTMPNTPALIGKGITGLFATPSVTEAQKQMAQTIIQAVGETVWVEEETLLDTVTAISGSGPAYVFYFIEALKAAGEKLGLDADQAEKLAITTFCGASELARQSDEPVPVLRERVTSPGGTTFAAISVMEEARLKEYIIAAAVAAAKRSVELGEAFGKAE